MTAAPFAPSPSKGERAPVLLDGAMGTALIGAGLPAAALPEQWLVERPDAIAAVHRAHAAAGARVVLTCTFNLAGPRLADAGVEASIEELAARAVALARAAAPDARVAGAVGPAWLPGGGEEAEWRERHGRALRALARAGADLLWTESHWILAEARTALAEGRATGLPVAVTFGLQDDGGRLHAGSGEDALECLGVSAREGAAAVGANCVLPGAPLGAIVSAAAARLGIPVVAKPSAGLPGAVVSPEAFADWIADLVRAGASWVGGCCGATDAHLRALASRIGAQ